MNVTLKCSALATALMAFACGDDSSSRPVFTTGVQASADASVASLPEDQREQICRDRQTYFETNVNLDLVTQARCLAGALILGGSADQCQQNLDRCIAESGDSSLGISIDVNAPVLTGRACTDELADCNASVNDLEACVNVNTGIVYNILDALSCRRSSDPETTDRAKQLRGAQACTSLGSRCAGFDEPVLR